MPQLSWVLGDPGGLGTGDLSGLEPVEERGQVTPEQSGENEPKPGIRVPSLDEAKGHFLGKGDWRGKEGQAWCRARV